MSGPINPRGGRPLGPSILALEQADALSGQRPRYNVPTTGSIGPVRRSLVGEAKAWLGELAQRTGQRFDIANAVITGLVNGGEQPAVPAAVEQFTRPSNLTGLESGGSGLVDSANGLPLLRMPNGIMSLQADPRIVDAAGIALPVAGFAGKTALDVARGLPGAVRDAGAAAIMGGRSQLWAGPKSATWNAGKAQAFEDFEKAGGSADAMWRAFGTGRVKDGSLIQEIDDSALALKTDFTSGSMLKDVVEHPELLKAYPQLADYRVLLNIDDTVAGRGHGWHDGDKRAFSVTAPNMQEARRLVAHEIQHAIDAIEGRATGGSPDKAGRLVQAALDDPDTSPELKAKLKQIAFDDHEAYQRLQGEVLARAAEARRDMGPDAREAESPQWDRDPEDWIVSRDTEPGISMALDPEAGRMPGLPESVALPDGTRAAVEPISDLRRIALDFMREKGLDPNLTTDEFRRVDPARGKAIADTFEAMKNDPTNPVVQASYRALIEDVKGQWDALQGMGYKFSFIEPGMPDPYAASQRLAIEDLKKNKHLWVYPTDQGFGNTTAVSVQDSVTNPLLAPTGVKIGDRELVANDLFRIVHDVWGHAKEGVGFRADGEENAWLQHIPTFRPQSRMALTTETRGQNSWLNFGPHGEANRTASAENTVFAPQKVGDLPAWVMDPNGMPPQGPQRSQATLNIGLKIGDTGNLDPNEALAALRGLGIDVTEMGIVQSGTEPTLVVGLNRAMAPGEAEMLARAIKQEAIAQKTGRSGALFGPGKEKWGPFNDDYFLNLKQLRSATKPPKAPVTKDEIALLTGEEKDIAKSLISASNAKAGAKAPPVTRGEVQDGVWNRAVYRGEKAATPGPKASEEEWAQWGDQYGVNVRRSDDVEVAPGVSIPGGLDGTFTIADIFELKARKIDPNTLPREVHDALMQKFIRTYDIPNPDPVDVFNRLAFAQLSPNAPLLPNEFLLQRLRATSMDDIRRLASREGQADLAKALDRESGVGAAARGGMGLKGTADLAKLAKLARAVIEKPEMFRAQPGETLRDVGLRVMNQIPGLGPKTVSLGVPWLDLPRANTSAVDLHMIRHNYERLLTDDRVGSDFVVRMAGLLKVEPNLSAVQAKIAEDPKGAEQAAINIIAGSSRSKVYRSKKTGDVNQEIPASLQPNLLLHEPKQATFFNEFYDRIVDFVNDSRGADPTLALFPEQWRLWDGYRGRIEPHEFAHPDFRKLPKQSFNEMQAALKANRRAGFGDYDKVKKTRDRVDWRELYYGKASPELLALIAAGGGAAASLPLLADEED